MIYEYLRDGRIKIDPHKKIKEPITYQDPCNVSRNGGLWEHARKIIPYIAEDFRDMAPNREHNHCCGGGGGIMPMGPDYKPFRMASGKPKAEQIKATGAKISTSFVSRSTRYGKLSTSIEEAMQFLMLEKEDHVWRFTLILKSLLAPEV